MAARDFKRMMDEAERRETLPVWVGPSVIRRAHALNAEIESQLAVRAPTALPFAKSLARLGFVVV